MNVTLDTVFDDYCEFAAQALEDGYSWLHVVTGHGVGTETTDVWLGGLHCGTEGWLTRESEGVLRQRLEERGLTWGEG